jgi:hypothetical protein
MAGTERSYFLKGGEDDASTGGGFQRRSEAMGISWSKAAI